MKRYGQVIKVKESQLESYKYHHAHPWKEINHMIKDCNISNYSIYHKDGYLFSYFEYVGNDFVSKHIVGSKLKKIFKKEFYLWGVENNRINS